MAACSALPPSKRRKLRQALGSVACAHGPGRCLTTALDLDHGLGDPAYHTATDTFHIWIGIISTDAPSRAEAQTAWAPIVADLRRRKRRRWHAVDGPTSAIIATLLDMGWDAQGPWTWESDLGTLFTCPEEELASGGADWG